MRNTVVFTVVSVGLSVLLGLAGRAADAPGLGVGPDRHDRRDDVRLGDAAAGPGADLQVDDRRRLRGPELPDRQDARGQLPRTTAGSISPLQGWSVITALVVWAGIPFLAITLNAGLTQVPKDLVEAATVDGANAWQIVPQRHAADPEAADHHRHHAVGHLELPGLHPDLGAAGRASPSATSRPCRCTPTRRRSASRDYSLGSAIALITVLLMLGVMAFYIRQMFKIGRCRLMAAVTSTGLPRPWRRRRRSAGRPSRTSRTGAGARSRSSPTSSASSSRSIMIFPVVLGDQHGVQAAERGALVHSRRSFRRTRRSTTSSRRSTRRNFLLDLRNSLIITISAVACALVVGFLAALAIARFQLLRPPLADHDRADGADGAPSSRS